MSTPTTPVLMSKANPDGWKLEELLAQLRLELHAKNDRIADDPRPTAKAVRANNLGMIDLLSVLEGRQRDTLARLDRLAPDQGPGGTPRLGAGAADVPAASLPTPSTGAAPAPADGIEPASAAAAPAAAQPAV
ncbi:hypothetical protein ABID82_007202 [Methylobacterium sp. PvP062]|uniref:Uncharacterized protein n=1 Tax=Methylobacterium radiotolerans TaxID=31998 RepID=A0ABV2NQ09_9HYPH|nr:MULTISPECIES: hypothetical protein [unclassified Methylobacterium]MBP2494677.1 hypothetical protein [Methylobacterium sp. PvP105]MBP2505452.1 hypothetical protein [Methylobacterium sp. PvP109]MCX7333605.1 hypothetical protein [Hyphomicrobiales bacterium]